MVVLQTIQQTLPNPAKADLDLYIRMVSEGSRAGMEALYLNTSTAIYAYALSVLKDPHDAEDILHDCYLRIHASAANYKSCGKPMAWIMTIAKNLCLMRLRERQKTAELSEEDWSHHWGNSNHLAPEDRTILLQCMELLPPEDRQIVFLHAVAGFKHREISQFLKLPLATVLSKYHRSLKKLRAYLEGEDQHEK